MVIITPDQRLRVFISSTLDLTNERAAVKRATTERRLLTVAFLWSSSPVVAAIGLGGRPRRSFSPSPGSATS